MPGLGRSALASAQEPAAPVYLAHRSDPVQKEYSTALLGFAFEKKRAFLKQSAQSEYERDLNLAAEIFQGYVLAKGMVKDPKQALAYPQAIALGAIRFAASSACDARAKQHVDRGAKAARDFLKINDKAFRARLSE